MQGVFDLARMNDMTRSEAIAIIERSLPSADEATLNAAAALLQAARPALSVLPRKPAPTPACSMALVEQSKADFKAGRTYTVTEARIYIDEALARRRVQRAKV